MPRDKKKFIRPIFEDNIQYFFIVKRPLSNDYEVPEIFNSKLLNSIIDMPKSIIQIINPSFWHQEKIKNNQSCHIDFNILFDDYPVEEYNLLFEIPSKILVFFLNTHNNEILKIIEGLNRAFIITSHYENIYLKILSSDNLKNKAFSNFQIFWEKLLNFTLEELNISQKVFADTKQQRIEEAKEILGSFDFREIALFLPSRNNVANFCQIFSLKSNDIFEVKIIDKKKRAGFLVETALNFSHISKLIKKNVTTNTLTSSKIFTTTLILSYPYFNPDHRKLFTEDIKQKKEDPKVLKQLRYARFIEQNIEDYDYNIKTKLGNDSLDFKLVSPICQLKQAHALFIDFVGYLHSTFELSPYIRVPIRGASLNNYINRLSPSQYKKFQTTHSLSKNLVDIGKALADNLPSEVLSFIENYIDCIFAISDLPLEWLLLKDIPLSFLCDICRTPETGLTSILAQYNINRLQKFQINKDILSRTLVVCGAKKDDYIFDLYQAQAVLNKKSNNLSYTTAHIKSKNEFFDLINKLRPELLILDSHGNFDSKNEGSYIFLGDEKLTGDDIVKNLPQVPLVILSCCWGTPIYGNSNTIAQAFFEKGSFSVISTFLPISIAGGFSLYFRVLNNLAYASEHSIHESWLNFISHNIRTSYIDNLLHPIIEKFGLNILDDDKYQEMRLIWQLKCMNKKTRLNAYKETSEIVLKCINNNYKHRIKNFFKSPKIIPEFMLYTQLGRGDLIKFSSWNQENKFE